MGQALYRKYRSKSLAEVVGQEHITTTLERALKTGKISHAYLFTGPRGTGKTSVARILAHEINGLPYTDDSMHLDIIEIDAASNRRIDEIRELRDRVNIAPTSAKYKVYIIDEVHMLTREAFNALLKTLEEPPAHVVFILATTEAHKLPETIVSRTQRFSFKPVPLEKVAEHLRFIAKQEKIKISDEALALVAAHGEGSFRDSISLLDQAAGNENEIDAEQVQTLLGTPPLEAVQELAIALLGANAAAVIAVLSRLHEQGFQPAQIAKRLSETWRGRILEAGQASPTDFQLLQNLLDVPAKPNPERYLEIILLEFALAGSNGEITPAPPKPTTPTKESEEPEKPPKHAAEKSDAENAAAPEKKAATEKIVAKTSTTHNDNLWPNVLAELKKEHKTLYGIARSVTPKFNENSLMLECTSSFHEKRLADGKNQKIIIDIIHGLTDQKVTIHCQVIKTGPKPVAAAEELVAAVHAAPQNSASEAATPDIASISNIFGGAELLES
jgi:DNA polymerase-3 subunit gamma/tau